MELTLKVKINGKWIPIHIAIGSKPELDNLLTVLSRTVENIEFTGLTYER
jgi:hypothetical protein